MGSAAREKKYYQVFAPNLFLPLLLDFYRWVPFGGVECCGMR
jgi:hypothetical protein